MKNIVDVITSPEFTALDNINRFNKTRVHKYESVSQHSYWVTTYASLFLEELDDAGWFEYFTSLNREKFKLKVLNACLFHDYDESLTGDILFDFKYNNYNGSVVREAIDNYIERTISPMGNGTIIERHIYDSIINWSYAGMNEAALKFIVKMGDWLACVKYEYSEFELGNKAFVDILMKSNESINTLIDLFVEKCGLKNNYNRVRKCIYQYYDITQKLNK